MRIRSGDTVLVIAGKEKGKTGRVDRQVNKGGTGGGRRGEHGHQAPKSPARD